MRAILKKFIDNVKSIDEVDYGDFMRKANHYLIELQEIVYEKADREAKQLLAEMKQHLQFNPNWDVESTRAFILQEATLMDHHV